MISTSLAVVIIGAFAVMQSQVILEAIDKFMDDMTNKLHKHAFSDPDSPEVGGLPDKSVPPVHNELEYWDPEFVKEKHTS